MKFAVRKKWLMVAIVICGAANVCLTGLAGEPFEDSVESTVYKFERSLYTDKEKNPDNEAERIRRTREFFAELNDAPRKIAAIGMMDSRYVYVVPPSLIPELLGKLLRDDDLTVRTRAVRAVAYNRLSGKFVDELLVLLEQPDFEIKKSVLHSMGRPGDERFLPAIRKHLSHADPSVRVAAVFALATWTPVEQVGDDVTALLKDPVPEVRTAAVQALVRFGLSPYAAQLVPMLNDESSLVRQRAIESLATLGTQATEAIARRLNDESSSVRAAAALGLANLQAEAFMADVAKLMHDDDVVVRRYAVKAFALFKAPAYRVKLESMLDDPDDYVQREALEALAALGDKSSAPKVARKLAHENLLVRQSAAFAMRSVGDATYSQQVLRLLDDEDVTLKIHALQALRIFGDKSVLPRIRMAAESDPSESVRDFARYVIEGLEG